jgi:hypothetical protein
MDYTPIDFINYTNLQGRTLPEILLRRPSWFFSMHEKRQFAWHGQHVVEQAYYLYPRARSIRIPADGLGQAQRVQYSHAPQGNRLGAVQIVPATRVPDSPRSWTADHVDLGMTYDRYPYDIHGGEKLGKLVARAFFPGTGSITSKRCEEFFLNPINFC